MTLKEFTELLLKKYPEDAVIVSTNSLAWFGEEVNELTAKDISHIIFLKDNPQKNHKPMDKPCLVIKDERRYDY